MRGGCHNLYDSTLQTISRGSVTSVTPSYCSRFFRVLASQGDSQVSVDVGAAVALLTYRPEPGNQGRGSSEAPKTDTPPRTMGDGATLAPLPDKAPPLKYVLASRLRPGDSVLVAREHETRANPWKVDSVLPVFHPHDVSTEIEGNSSGVLGPSDASNAGIAMVEGVAFVAVRDSGPRPKSGLMGEGSGGRGEGDSTEGKNRKERKKDTTRSPRFAKPPDELVVDTIQLSAEALHVLKLRGGELAALYESERKALPDSGNHMPRSRVLDLWRRLLAGKEQSGTLPIDAEQVHPAMDAWFQDLLHRRHEFLTDQTNVDHLAEVLLLETLTASWFGVLGLERSRDRLLLEIVELAIYAGCEHEEPRRLGARLGPHLSLQALLRVPHWVLNLPSDGQAPDAVASLNQTALSVALEWANRVGFVGEIDRGAGTISLSGLLAYWAEVSGGDIDPFWEDLPRVESVSQDQWKASPLARAFETWVSTCANRIRAEAPPADPATIHFTPIVTHVLDTLESTPIPMGPEFPIKGPVPSRDETAPLTSLGDWALNLVTACECFQDPFRNSRGRALSPTDLINPSGNADRPFAFVSPETASKRQVDGSLRSRFARIVESGVHVTPVAKASLLARVVMDLPNDADNSKEPEAKLLAYRNQRQSTYDTIRTNLLDKSIHETDRDSLLEFAMLVEVSNREQKPLSPSFPSLGASYVSLSSAKAVAQTHVQDQLLHRARIQERMNQRGLPPLQAQRRAIDAALAVCIQDADCGLDDSLRRRDWVERLESIDDRRVLEILQLRGHLKAILGEAGRSGNPTSWRQDLNRARGLLELVDDTVFYSRPDMDSHQSQRYFRALGDGGSRWRPALVGLAWIDAGFQESILELRRSCETTCSPISPSITAMPPSPWSSTCRDPCFRTVSRGWRLDQPIEPS